MPGANRGMLGASRGMLGDSRAMLGRAEGCCQIRCVSKSQNPDGCVLKVKSRKMRPSTI